jgi:hypothetical protein
VIGRLAFRARALAALAWLLMLPASSGCGSQTGPADTAGQAGAAISDASAGDVSDGATGLPEAAQEGDSVGADAPQPIGCVEARVQGAILPDGNKWYPGAVWVPPRPGWRDDRGLHAIWMDYETKEADGGKVQTMHAVVSSFDASSGSADTSLVFDPFPPGQDGLYTAISSSAGADGGHFALGVRWLPKGAPYALERVLLGRLDKTDLQASWTPPWSIGDNAAVVDIGWDGEAFAVHGFINGLTGLDLMLVRLAPDGAVVLPATRVGLITSVLEYYHDFQTDPVTGTTWVVSPAYTGVWVTGHLRDGTPLPGTEKDGGVLVEAQGVKWKDPSSFTAIGAGPAGSLVAWSDLPETGNYVQRLGQDLMPQGNATILMAVGVEHYAQFLGKAIASAPGGWWVGAEDRKSVTSFSLSESAQVLARSKLVTYSALDCIEAKTTCPPGVGVLDVRRLSTVTWNDELWFGFWDYSGQQAPPPQYIPWSPYRFVRVKPGCVYKSMYDVVMGW